MEENHAARIVWITAAAAGAALIALSYWGPLARFVERFQADPEKGFKAIAITGVFLFVIVGLAMSIFIMLKLLKVV